MDAVECQRVQRTASIAIASEREARDEAFERVERAVHVPMPGDRQPRAHRRNQRPRAIALAGQRCRRKQVGLRHALIEVVGWLFRDDGPKLFEGLGHRAKIEVALANGRTGDVPEMRSVERLL